MTSIRRRVKCLGLVSLKRGSSYKGLWRFINKKGNLFRKVVYQILGSICMVPVYAKWLLWVGVSKVLFLDWNLEPI